MKRKEEIVDVAADVYVIAVGTNDVRYRTAKVSSMTPEEFVANVDRLVQSVKAKHRAASFVFVGAWTTDHYDPISALGEKDPTAEPCLDAETARYTGRPRSAGDIFYGG